MLFIATLLSIKIMATKPDWSTMSGKDVLIIAPSLTTQDSEAVSRRLNQLKDEDRDKLVHQGLPIDCLTDDKSIMSERCRLDKEVSEVSYLDGPLTRGEVKEQITKLLNNTTMSEVLLIYIGPGKRRTGDWCFSDGFITLREIMDIYINSNPFNGRVLSIVSDCSYSGSWVREAMTFMDEQGVGPCGHVAQERGTLVKIYTSCQSNEISTELVFSLWCATNDKNTGDLSFSTDKEKIFEYQHPSELDFTRIQCKNKIGQPCTMAPGSTWKRWRMEKRCRVITGTSKGRPIWCYLLMVDDDDIMRLYEEKMASGANVNVEDYGMIIKSGLGLSPPEEVKKEIREQYSVNYNYTKMSS